MFAAVDIKGALEQASALVLTLGQKTVEAEESIRAGMASAAPGPYNVMLTDSVSAACASLRGSRGRCAQQLALTPRARLRDARRDSSPP
jgi:hypothetical protein